MSYSNNNMGLVIIYAIVLAVLGIITWIVYEQSGGAWYAWIPAFLAFMVLNKLLTILFPGLMNNLGSSNRSYYDDDDDYFHDDDEYRHHTWGESDHDDCSSDDSDCSSDND